MINDSWDIAHITIAVPDLERAMEHYGALLGVGWGPMLDVGSLPVLLYDADGSEVSEGLREVWSLSGALDGTGPALELANSRPGTASQTIWGVPDGVERFHHVCYYVDDLIAESAHLSRHGFAREVSTSPPTAPPEFMAYHLSPTGTRFELMRSQDKPAMQHWLSTGEMALE